MIIADTLPFSVKKAGRWLEDTPLRSDIFQPLKRL